MRRGARSISATATALLLDGMQGRNQRGGSESGVEDGSGVEEILAVEADCGVAVAAREARIGEACAQQARGLGQAPLGLDVATERDAGAPPGVQRRRSMTTPTSRAWRIAPGLLIVRRTQARANSCNSSAASRSASVSTR